MVPRPLPTQNLPAMARNSSTQNVPTARNLSTQNLSATRTSSLSTPDSRPSASFSMAQPANLSTPSNNLAISNKFDFSKAYSIRSMSKYSPGHTSMQQSATMTKVNSPTPNMLHRNSPTPSQIASGLPTPNMLPGNASTPSQIASGLPTPNMQSGNLSTPNVHSANL